MSTTHCGSCLENGFKCELIRFDSVFICCNEYCSSFNDYDSTRLVPALFENVETEFNEDSLVNIAVFPIHMNICMRILRLICLYMPIDSSVFKEQLINCRKEFNYIMTVVHLFCNNVKIIKSLCYNLLCNLYVHINTNQNNCNYKNIYENLFNTFKIMFNNKKYFIKYTFYEFCNECRHQKEEMYNNFFIEFDDVTNVTKAITGLICCNVKCSNCGFDRSRRIVKINHIPKVSMILLTFPSGFSENPCVFGDLFSHGMKYSITGVIEYSYKHNHLDSVDHMPDYKSYCIADDISYSNVRPSYALTFKRNDHWYRLKSNSSLFINPYKSFPVYEVKGADIHFVILSRDSNCSLGSLDVTEIYDSFMKSNDIDIKKIFEEHM